MENQRWILSSSPPTVAKFVIPVLLYYIVTLIVPANWETGPGGKLCDMWSVCVCVLEREQL